MRGRGEDAGFWRLLWQLSTVLGGTEWVTQDGRYMSLAGRWGKGRVVSSILRGHGTVAQRH